jgi:hypothetical protein
MTNNLITPPHIRRNPEAIRSNLVKTSAVHGIGTWIAIAVIGMAVVFAAVYFLRKRR